MTGTKNDRDMRGGFVWGVGEIWGRKHIFTTTQEDALLLIGHYR